MIKCPRCNADMIVDATIILTSYPPQYTLICPECGHTITRQCSECEENKHLYTFDEVNELQKKAHWSEYERGYKDGYAAGIKYFQEKLDEVINNLTSNLEITRKESDEGLTVKVNCIPPASKDHGFYTVKANWTGTDPMSVGTTSDPHCTSTRKLEDALLEYDLDLFK